MKICFVGLDNLPVLAPEYKQHPVGGASVQQTLLARALARRGHDVSMVVADLGQADDARWDAIRVLKAYRPDAGLPLLRFIHPRWTELWSALRRADADLYYTSCAGMHVGLLALFCRRFHKRFVFRSASESDCDPSRLLVRFARDRWLYAYGLRRAEAILVQSRSQAEALACNYGLAARVAGSFVENSSSRAARDIDVLWISNIRQLKRPDRVLDLAAQMPHVRFHLVGGPLAGEETLFHDVARAAAARPNVFFHGGASYWDANTLYLRARVLLNTSDVEGFPNSYLQAWIRGVPVVTLIDPDGVIVREGLGVAARSMPQMLKAVSLLVTDAIAWKTASARCRAFMEREYGEDKVLPPYLETFERVLRGSAAAKPATAANKPHHA